jgi:hypothetical protein
MLDSESRKLAYLFDLKSQKLMEWQAILMFSESSLTCGLRSDEDDVKTGCKNVKLFFVEPLVPRLISSVRNFGNLTLEIEDALRQPWLKVLCS